jgi:4-amino-4-deoxy-L-arabinose transferase-like glycosyltransferase
MSINIINKKIFFVILIIFSFFKFFFAFVYGDHFYEMEWSIIVKNLIEDFSFSFHEIDNQKIPTAYMPPLYAYLMYAIAILGFSEFVNVKLILFLQCFFSGISIIFFYRILRKFFNEKSSIIFSLIYFLIPLNFYSATQISSVSFQISIFIFFLFYYLNTQTYLDFLKLGIFSSLALLIRGEFWLLLFILIIFKIISNNIHFKKIIIFLLTIIIIISPTIIRNYLTFNQIVLVKSTGYNLWRGNSDSFNINGENLETSEIQKKRDEIINTLIEKKNLEEYEIYLDKMYFDIAKKNIFSNIGKYFVHYINKLFAFSFFNFYSNYPNNFHPLILFPEVIISTFGILGIIFNIFSKKINYEFLIITFYYLALIPIFFILPRYKLFIFPMYIFFSCYFFTFLSNKIFSKKQ